jgi:hypothetical protein
MTGRPSAARHSINLLREHLGSENVVTRHCYTHRGDLRIALQIAWQCDSDWTAVSLPNILTFTH